MDQLTHYQVLIYNYSIANINSQGIGVIDTIPQFADSANGDYSLVPGSPGVADAGLTRFKW